MALVTEVTIQKSAMVVSTAASALPVDTFTKDSDSDTIMDDDLDLRLSEGEDTEDCEKNSQTSSKTEPCEPTSAETEDDILNKYEAEDAASGSLDSNVENALLSAPMDRPSENSNTASAVNILETDDKEMSEVQPDPETTGKLDELHDTKEPTADKLESAENSTSTVNETELTSREIQNTDVTNKEDIEIEEPKEDCQERPPEEKEDCLDEIIPPVTDEVADNLQCAKENVQKNLKETMDTEDLLQVTTVKEITDDIDVPDNEKDENSSSASSEKDETDETMDTVIGETADKFVTEPDVEESDSKLAKDDNECVDAVDIEEHSPLLDDAEMDESTDKVAKDDGESVDAVDIEENSPLVDDKFADDVEMNEVGGRIANEKSTDAVDIEENSPLAEELNNKVEEEYQSFLNKENENNVEPDDSEKQKKDVSDKNKVSECEMEVSEDSEKTDVTDCENSLVSEKDVSDATKTDKAIVVNGSRKSCDLSDKAAVKDAVRTADHEIKNELTSEPADESTKSGKRPLSESEVDAEAKKIKLSRSFTPTNAGKSIVILNTLSEFMRNGSLKQLSRTCLEEFCLQKMCEVLLHKSDVGELRQQLQKQEQMVEVWRKEYNILAKQLKDLDVVNKKLLNELKVRTDRPIIPVKITRSVGLQVKMLEPSAGPSSKKRASRGSDVSTTPTHKNRTPVKSTPPTQPVRLKQVAPKPSNTPLLSQALQKDVPTNSQSPTKSVAQKGVIDLTDEDDKKKSASPLKAASTNKPVNASTVNKAQTAVRSTIPAQSIQLVSPQLKPTIPGVVTSSGQRLMYVVSNPQLSQNIITNTNELTKPGAPKALMLKFQNGIIGQTNGIIPTIQNGTSTISVLPQVTTVRNGQVRFQTSPRTIPLKVKCHPAPLPQPPALPVGVTYRKPLPPKPHLSIRKSGQGIVLSWKMPYKLDIYETIASYQLYAYQETSSPPSSDMWRKVGDVKALALPMACTLTQFADGNKYYFAVRAVDVLKRIGPFSDPEQIML